MYLKQKKNYIYYKVTQRRQEGENTNQRQREQRENRK